MTVPRRTADSYLWPSLALLLGGWAALRTLYAADSTAGMEEGSGTLTGPLVNVALLGSVILLAGAVVQIWRPRAGLYLSSIGFVLALPLFSWLFGAGTWCSTLGDCHGEYPLLRFDSYSAVSIVLALLSIGLQARPLRT